VDKEIGRKRTREKGMPVAVEKICIPANASEIRDYLRHLDDQIYHSRLWAQASAYVGIALEAPAQLHLKGAGQPS
jgi:hypothetical protein